MKYVKTFENFNSDQKSQKTETEKVVDVNLDSQEDKVKEIAKRLGLNPEEAANIFSDLSEEEKKTNEEEEPFTLVSLAAITLGPLLIGGSGLLYAKIAKNKGLKRYVMDQAEMKVKEMIKKDPSLVDNMDNLVKKAYDEMMANKEFIKELKTKDFTNYGAQRGRGFSATAGYL
jgi:hypothetical protein